MRHAPNLRIERYRDRTPGLWPSSREDGNSGFFWIEQRRGPVLRVLATDGMGWDHVSVSTAHRCPTWEEMAFVKDLFFHEEEAVFQYHPPRSRYVNYHPFCLHLWRPQDGQIALPPVELVGPLATEDVERGPQHRVAP